MAVISNRHITTLDDFFGGSEVATWQSTLKTEYDTIVSTMSDRQQTFDLAWYKSLYGINDGTAGGPDLWRYKWDDESKDHIDRPTWGWTTDTVNTVYPNMFIGNHSYIEPDYVNSSLKWVASDSPGEKGTEFYDALVTKFNVPQTTTGHWQPSSTIYGNDPADLDTWSDDPMDRYVTIGTGGPKASSYHTVAANSDSHWSPMSHNFYWTCKIELVLTPTAKQTRKFRDVEPSTSIAAGVAVSDGGTEHSYDTSICIINNKYETRVVTASDPRIVYTAQFLNVSYDDLRNAVLTKMNEIGNVDGSGYIEPA